MNSSREIKILCLLLKNYRKDWILSYAHLCSHFVYNLIIAKKKNCGIFKDLLHADLELRKLRAFDVVYPLLRIA